MNAEDAVREARKALREAFVKKIEETARAVDRMQAENRLLLTSSTSADDEIMQAKAELRKANAAKIAEHKLSIDQLKAEMALFHE